MRNRILFIVPHSAISNSFASQPCSSVQIDQIESYKKVNFESENNRASIVDAITITASAEENSTSYIFFNNSYLKNLNILK